mmetsp:Transcript_153781/g.294789  ORF Transcript_153781/g.294789 Transcript_153781/m.294789 type:complete len:394 (+) Transcript_153781:72-1253(+)
MGRRAARDNQAVICAECGKSRPRSAFPKTELAGRGGERCRLCAPVQCRGCNQWLPPGKFDEGQLGRRSSGGEACCRTCQGNEQIDRLLQTPKDEVTHFGSHFVFQLQREAEHILLLACHRYGICERLLLQKILDFFRVPFIHSQNGMHYCELCDDTFQEVRARERVQMAIHSNAADWSGCPGARLAFITNQVFQVAELQRVPSGQWFFRAQVRQAREVRLGEDVPDIETLLEDGHMRAQFKKEQAPPTHFQSRWAPWSATMESRGRSAIMEHHRSMLHKKLEERVASGRSCLLNHAALQLSKRLGERPSMSLSRLRDGLGLRTRFCSACDVEQASSLERVRDLDIPLRVVKEALGKGRDGQLLWITRSELFAVEDAYQSQMKTTRKKVSQRNR